VLADDLHRFAGALVARDLRHVAERHRHDALLEVVGAHYSSVSLRRQLRRLGFRWTSMSVFIMTHAGTRLFWFSSFASRFFFAFDFLPIVALATPPPLKILFL
jgi:hypothetical protein